MSQTNSTIHEKLNNKLYLNLIFAAFPVSLIVGTFIVNLNFVIFCCLGFFYLKSKILKTKFSFPIKIIFLLFFTIFFSTAVSFGENLYFNGYDSSYFERLIKSILFFRYFLFLIIIYFLVKYDYLNFKYFFIAASFSAILLSLDIIFQYTFGFNMLGFKSGGFVNSGFFGNEYVAGGYIQRFSIFAIFFIFFFSKEGDYKKFILPIVSVCILGSGIFLSGSRMPIILFLFGLFLLFFLKYNIKKIIFVSLVSLIIFLQFIISFNESHKNYLRNAYGSFFINVKNMTLIPSRFGIPIWSKSYLKSVGKERNESYSEQVKEERETKEKAYGSKVYFYDANPNNMHKRLFSTAVYTWRANKIFGNGIKSFREDCYKLKRGQISLAEDLYRECSNHPHNYYFELLTETGIVGLSISFIIGFIFIIFIFKNINHIQKNNINSIILLSAIISLILEFFPIRSTGSLFTTNNTTYVILIASIVLCNKKIMEFNK
jgi:O-antigen ligase